MDYKQIKAIEKANKERIKKVCPNVTEESGIYIFTRYDNNYKFAYVGQAKHLLTRLASHLQGYKQHIDLSLKKYKLYSKNNQSGWKLWVTYCDVSDLDEREESQRQLLEKEGFLMHNKVVCGQGKGRTKIAEYKESKGYNEGLKKGYLNAQRDIAKWCKWFDIKYDANKVNACKAYAKFKEFIECN